MVSREITIAIIISSMVFGLIFQAHQAVGTINTSFPGQKPVREAAEKAAPIAVSGNDIYTAWNNASASLHGDAIFFTKSTDGGKNVFKRNGSQPT